MAQSKQENISYEKFTPSILNAPKQKYKTPNIHPTPFVLDGDEFEKYNDIDDLSSSSSDCEEEIKDNFVTPIKPRSSLSGELHRLGSLETNDSDKYSSRHGSEDGDILALKKIKFSLEFDYSKSENKSK